MKVQNPTIGHASGQSGGLVFQTYFGNTYARSLPVLFHYPATTKQQEAQAQYFNIFWQYRDIYRSFGKFSISANMRYANRYNAILKGIFKVAQVFPSEQGKPFPRFIGTDRQHQVRLSTSSSLLDVTSENIALKVDVLFSLWRRKFSPIFFHFILVNTTTKELLSVSNLYSDSSIRFEISNDVSWQSSQTIAAYVALSNTEFFTNFYLITL